MNDIFLNDVIADLGQVNKALQCKYFYDEIGSQLFDKICELDEYYLTRTEVSIMEKHAAEMAQQLGPEIALVEFGSGSSIKSRILLDALIDPVAYMLLDISEDHLMKTAEQLRKTYTDFQVLPIVADFTKGFELPSTARPYSHAAVYFPGSTIGNFTPRGATDLLQRIGQILGSEGGLLIGVDLQKDPAIIEAAYNDAEGITQQFNLNVLHRVNRELGANFDVNQFEHLAFYHADEGRVEIYVVSTADQVVTIGDHEFRFTKDERIFTEYSHKYTLEGLGELAAESGFTIHKHWTDAKKYFAVVHLVNESS